MREAVIIGFVDKPAESPRLISYARQALSEGAYLIGADSGGEIALGWNLQPTIVVGDFDSISPTALSYLRDKLNVEVRTYPVEKDETDLELALNIAVDELGCQNLTVIGGIGGRFDHTLGNLYLLSSARFSHCQIRVLTEREEIFVLWGKKELALEGLPNEQVSLIPLTTVAQDVHTEGLYYPLRSEPLFFGPSRGISNKFIGQKARVLLQDGILLVIHSFSTFH